MTVTRQAMRLTMTAGIHARFAHRVDGLVHSHPWLIEATVEGPADAAKVMPADDLEAILQARRRVLARQVPDRRGPRSRGRGTSPLVWDAEPTVEEIARRLWDHLLTRIPTGLVSLAVVESTEFDRSRTVRLSVER